jgi:hypothetical protein
MMGRGNLIVDLLLPITRIVLTGQLVLERFATRLLLASTYDSIHISAVLRPMAACENSFEVDF